MNTVYQASMDSRTQGRAATTVTRFLKAATVVMGLLAAGLVSTAKAASPPGKEPVVCSFQTSGGDIRVFKCPLEGSGATQAYRFRAGFSGGHDDTSASMTLTLDGAPLLCDAGSKTRLFGEDGDVSLECRFQIKAKAGVKLLLGVTLLWSHAQYAGTELVQD